MSGPDGLPGLGGLIADAADQLGGYRLAELTSACAALGIVDHRMLGGVGTFRRFRHGRARRPATIRGHSCGRPSAARTTNAAVALLAAVLDEVEPDVVLTYDADGGYGHPDHIAAHQVAVAAARRCGVPRVLAVVRPRHAIRRGASGGRPRRTGFRRATESGCRDLRGGGPDRRRGSGGLLGGRPAGRRWPRIAPSSPSFRAGSR